jgi:L-threonylcarbamoyladenylate synthase
VPSEGEGAAHSKKTLNLSAHGDLIEAASNLFSHLRALDAAGAVACCWSMIVSESR